MEYFTPAVLDFIDKVGTFAVIVLLALAVITDKLVWHTRYKRALEEIKHWQGLTMEAYKIGAQAGVQAAETAVSVVSAIPDPQGDRDRARTEGTNP